MRQRILLIPLIVQLLAAQAHSQEVGFHFGWKPGMQCKVEREAKEANNPRKGEAKVTWTLQVSALGKDRLLVATRDMAIVPQGAGQAMSAAERAQLKMISAVGNVSFSVTRDGEFVAVENLADMQRDLRALEKEPGIDRFYLDSLIKSLTLDALQQGAEAEWEKTFGQWRDLRLSPGVAMTGTQLAILPIGTGVNLSMPVLFKLESLAPCTGKPGARCASVFSSQTPGDEEMAKLIAGASRDGKAPLPGFAIRGFKRTTRAVFEADSLVPRSFSESIQAQFSSTVNGRLVEMTSDKNIVDTYACN